MSTPISYKRDERGFTTFTTIETIDQIEYNRFKTESNNDTTLFIDNYNKVFASALSKDVYTRKTVFYIGDNGVYWTRTSID